MQLALDLITQDPTLLLWATLKHWQPALSIVGQCLCSEVDIMLPLAFQSGFVFLVAYAAVSDYRLLKIPNWVSLALCGMFLIYTLLVPGASSFLQHLGAGAAVF